VKYIDTYALVEIADGNPKFVPLLQEKIVVNDITLAEFYFILYREYGLPTAEYWRKKLDYCTQPVARNVLLQAVRFRYDHKKSNLSFFDCVGYIFAQSNNVQFVTGDKEFKHLEGVEFIAR